jgi:carboxypeptidase Taq
MENNYSSEVTKDLELIERYQKEITLLGQTSALLHWDNQTYMPKKAVEGRSEQLSFLRTLIHEKMIDGKFSESVKRLLDRKEELNDRDRLMILRLNKNIEKASKLSKEFVEKMSKTCSLSFDAWKLAREKKDWEIFRLHLEKVVELKREEAKLYGFQGSLYNGLMDDFEEGMSVEKLIPIFEKLKIGLIKILEKVESSDKYKEQKESMKNRDFSHASQIEMAKEMAVSLGLSEEFARLDLSEHPFSTHIGKDDYRITTNVRDDPFFSVGSTIHEAGHALYEYGLPDEECYNVLGEAASYGLHESQSRFWELMIGLSEEFWRYFFPKFDSKFGLDGKFDDWYREINMIKKNPIRIESDEVHYCLHIIMRFEIAVGLIDGSIEVADLRDVWNSKMKEYFGIEVKDDKEGVLQDVHWSEGYFGYFPSYAIGTIYAAQLFGKLKEEMPDVMDDVSRGEFSSIREWLHDSVHCHGSKKLADDIVRDCCGNGLDVDAFLEYLEEKYKELYGF